MSKMKVGVVGVGSLGRHHARIYAGLPDVEWVGVYDVDRERAEAITREHGGRAFDSLESFADAVEAASVAAPTDRHREIAGLLLDRGLHLLVEKPIAATTREAEEMVALAEERDRILQVGHVERFNPALRSLESIAREPRFIEAHRLASYPPPREGLHPRGTEVSVVLDLMIHDLEVILHLVRSPVAQIHAVGVPVLSPSEDIANARLQFENGCVANVTASRISPERMRKIRVFLPDAYISLDYQNQAGTVYRRGDAGIEHDEVPVKQGDPLTLELSSFLECCRDGRQPLVSGERGAEALSLAARIQHEMQQGTAV